MMKLEPHLFGPTTQRITFTDDWGGTRQGGKWDHAAGVIQVGGSSMVYKNCFSPQIAQKDAFIAGGVKQIYILDRDNNRIYWTDQAAEVLKLGWAVKTLGADNTRRLRWYVPLKHFKHFIYRNSHGDWDGSEYVPPPRKKPVRIKPTDAPVFAGPFRPNAVLTREQLDEVVEYVSRYDEFVFDLETVGTRESRHKKDIPSLDWKTNEIIWISIGTSGRAWAIPVGHPTGPEQLSKEEVFSALKPIFFSDRRKINQNVQFDLLTISKYFGEVPPPPYGELQVAMHIMNENLFKLGGFNLANVVDILLGFKYRKLAREGEPMSSYPFDDVALYSYLDAKMTWLCWSTVMGAIEQNDEFRDLFMMEMDVLDVLLKMRVRGVKVERAGFERMSVDLRGQLLRLEQDIYKAAGYQFNINSVQQKAKLLYDELKLVPQDLTNAGARATGEDALKPLRRRHKVVPLLLEHAEATKIHSTYIKGFLPWIHEDERIRASFKQHGTTTGRFSCSEPNLQNIPRSGDDESKASQQIRSLFVAPPGYVLVVGDYATVELRLLAHYCRDPAMLRAYRGGLDLHAITAAGIFGVPVAEVTSEQRSMGKTSNFNFSYGGGPRRVIEATGCTYAEAKRAFEGYHSTFPGVRTWSDYIKRETKDMEDPYVTTILGRRRRLPDIQLPGKTRKEQGLKAYAERQAVNTIIQGSAADIMKMAIVRCDRRIERSGHRHDWFLTLTVHDELVMEVPERDADAGVQLMTEAMEGVKVKLRVPLEASVHYGKSWADAKG